MKLWMLGNRLTTETYERSRFVEEADKYGISIFTVWFMLTKLILIVSRDDRKSIRHCNDALFLSQTVYLLGLGVALTILISVFSDNSRE